MLLLSFFFLTSAFYSLLIFWCRIVSSRLTGRAAEERTISNIEGNLQGLKAHQIRRLEKLYQRRIPTHQIVTLEFARQLSEVSHDIHRQVGVLVNRSGYVEYVVVGNARGIVLAIQRQPGVNSTPANPRPFVIHD